MKQDNELVIYQAKDGALELRGDVNAQTIWASQKQIAQVFNVTPQNITIHLKNIFNSGELNSKTTCKESLQVQKEGTREVKRKVKEYNLDVMISVGYRIDSTVGTNFRKWATKTLKSYISEGYVINPARVEQNRSKFLQVIDDLKILSGGDLVTTSVADLTAHFARTWFTLDAYDKDTLPSAGGTKRVIHIQANHLTGALHDLKQQLIANGEATDIFARPRQTDGLESIFGNIFQSFNGNDVYPAIEDKAANLLYLVVKNHIFVDGNKRSGAYAFVWFLKEAKILDVGQISSAALTAITLLVAQSDPKDKEKMIGLIKLLLGVDY